MANFSQVKYRYDIGANIWAKSPTIDGNAANSGKETVREFDNIGRPTKETLVNTGTYSRYEYPTNGVQSKVYSTITDVNNNGADSADEVLSESWADGAGRVRRSRSELPNSIGGFSGSLVEYNILGQVKRSSVPTEIGLDWLPAGDDATRGFLWTSKEYDWKGRTTRENNTDGTDRIISYNGCGCAGGQVTTIEGEQLAEGRRTQKIYADILGREFKSEVLNWNGTVYSSSTTTFDGADRPRFARQFDGIAILNNSHQTTSMTYDGFGRLKTRHVPLQETGAATTFTYNIDNSLQTATDARGATANYLYQANTGLLEQISYTSPNPTIIPVTPTTTFTYDNSGNRKSMTDGAGNVQYEYNSLSQMKSETRYFNENLPFAPLVNGVRGFKLEYNYTMNGQLKSLKDPYGQQINYDFDKVGRLSNVSGTTFGGVTNYANNPQYRAFGALKQLEYGDNNARMNQTFNNRLQVDDYLTTKTYSNGNTVNVVKSQYLYNGDGSMKASTNNVNPAYNRAYSYDSVGRLKTEMASGVPIGQVNYGSTYKEEFFYDAFGRMIHRKGKSWEGTTSEIYLHFNHDINTNAQKYNYINGREQNPDYVYDSEGNLTRTTLLSFGNTSVFDTSGQLVKSVAPANGSSETDWKRDGQGQEARHGTRTYSTLYNQWNSWSYKYFIISSVLKGQIITEAHNGGRKDRTYVYAGGELLARQVVGTDQNHTEKVSWRHADASGKTERWATVGSVASLSGRSPDYAELNADGMSLPVNNFDDGSLNLPEIVSREAHPNGEMVMGGGGCEYEGEAISCSMVEGLKEYQAMVSNAGKKKEEKSSISITIIRESGRTQDSTVWHSPSKDKSNGLAYNPANSRANPSSLSTVTYKATQPLATVQSEQSLEDWLEQLWTKPVRPQQTDELKSILDRNRKARAEEVLTTTFKIDKKQKVPERKTLDKRFFKAYAAASVILSGSSGSCAAWFGKQGINALDSFIDKAVAGIVNVDGKPSQFVGIQQSNNPNGGMYNADTSGNTTFIEYDNVTINSNGPFLNSFSIASRNGYGNYAHVSLSSQTLQILHEIAHLVYRNGKPLIPVDGGGVLAPDGKKLLSEENTETVLFYCQGEIEEIDELANK